MPLCELIDISSSYQNDNLYIIIYLHDHDHDVIIGWNIPFTHSLHPSVMIARHALTRHWYNFSMAKIQTPRVACIFCVVCYWHLQAGKHSQLLHAICKGKFSSDCNKSNFKQVFWTTKVGQTSSNIEVQWNQFVFGLTSKDSHVNETMD